MLCGDQAMYKSAMHSMGVYGALNCGRIAPDALDTLRAHCENTPPFYTSSANSLFPPQVRALLQQAHLDERNLLCSKLQDGFVLMTQQHKIVCVIKDTRSCVAKSFDQDDSRLVPVACGVRATVTSSDGHKSYFYSIAQDPRLPPIKPIKLVHHDGVTAANEVSVCSPVDHVVSHFASLVPMVHEPRTLFATQCMGNVTGRQLQGPLADFMKKVLLAGISQASASGAASSIYGSPIQISDTVAKHLMIRPSDEEHSICVAKLKDGIAFYRDRNDGKRSIVGMGYSPDFNSARPDPVDQSTLNLIKVTYSDKRQSAPRIFLHSSGDAVGDTPPVIPGVTSIEELKSIIEHTFRQQHRESLGCNSFPDACRDEAKHYLRQTNQTLNDPNSIACRLMLDMHPMSPNNDYLAAYSGASYSRGGG